MVTFYLFLKNAKNDASSDYGIPFSPHEWGGSSAYC